MTTIADRAIATLETVTTEKLRSLVQAKDRGFREYADRLARASGNRELLILASPEDRERARHWAGILFEDAMFSLHGQMTTHSQGGLGHAKASTGYAWDVFAPSGKRVRVRVEYVDAYPSREGCICGQCDGTDRWWECEHCKRTVPYCDGSADDSPELCDQCWARRDASGQPMPRARPLSDFFSDSEN